MPSGELLPAVTGSAKLRVSLHANPRSIELNTELGLLIESEDLAEEVALRFEKAVAPETSWNLSLERGSPRWTGLVDGKEVVLTTEPNTSWWLRCKVWMLGWLPIQGQL